MITKNINGSDLSDAFINEIHSDSPRTVARLLKNGTLIDCDVVQVIIEKGSCGAETFQIGDIIGTTLKATLKNLTVPLKGEEVECQIGAWTGSDYEYLTICKAKISEAKSTRYQTEIVGYSSVVSDTLSVFDITNLPTEPTIADVADLLETQLDRTITFDDSIDTAQVITESLAGLVAYQALQVLAITSGGYVINDNENNILVKQYGGTSVLIVSSGAILIDSNGNQIITQGYGQTTEVPVDTGMMVNLPVIEETRFEITGVSCTIQEGYEDSEGQEVPPIEYYTGVVNYAMTSKFVTEDIFNANIASIKGYSYFPATVGLTLGDPRIEGGDTLCVTDVDGSQYVVPCHRITHKYTGGFTSTIKSVDATDIANDVGTMPPLSAQIAIVTKDVVRAQYMADTAEQYAQSAEASANQAQASAESAGISATNALNQLGVVENVVGVLEMLATHGEYALTEDTAVQDGKWYFERSGSGTTEDPYTYAVANLEVGSDPTGYYELTSIDEAVTNYVSSHLALTDDGLSLQQNDSDYRILINSTGLSIIGLDGAVVAQYSTETTIGDQNGFHVQLSGTELGFYQAEQRVAYISNNQLYITQSVVLQQMDLGVPVTEGGLGQWTWIVREINGANNLTLKWMG